MAALASRSVDGRDLKYCVFLTFINPSPEPHVASRQLLVVAAFECFFECLMLKDPSRVPQGSEVILDSGHKIFIDILGEYRLTSQDRNSEQSSKAFVCSSV